MDNLTKITHALSALQTRANDDAFVVIQHRATQKFVQFAIAEPKKLWLDLPAQTLSEVEFYRAVDFFRKRGITGEEYAVFDRPDGEVAGTQFTFNMSFSSAIEASTTASKILSEVYGFLSDCELEIIEN